MTQDLCFAVTPGRAYTLGFVLQGAGATLSRTSFCVQFSDAAGQPVDIRSLQSPVVIPALDPIVVEVHPALPVLTEGDDAAQAASRVILAPPDAVAMTLVGSDPDLRLQRISLGPLDLEEVVRDGTAIQTDLAARVAQRVADLADTDVMDDATRAEWTHLFETTLRQHAALMDWFTPSGDWSAVLERLRDGVDRDDYDLRLRRLAGQAKKPLPVIGFIGSARGRERLEGFARLVWLRSDQLAEQLATLPLQAIVIESALGSGAGETDWLLAFSGLDGDMPDAGCGLFDAAAQAGVPVHLWMTGDPAAGRLWRACAARADRVIVEGEGWADLPVDLQVAAATEPAACSLAAVTKRDTHLMLVPVAADLLQDAGFANLLSDGGLYRPLLTEFRYAFNRGNLRDRLADKSIPMLGETGRAEHRALLQAATIVLLGAHGPRSDAELAQMAMDAIASGAIPVLYGTPRSDDALLAALDHVTTRSDLVALQGLYRIRWVQERRWRGLMARVTADHLWSGRDRAVVLGADPMPADFDRPLVSVVLVTKRPHLLHRCLQTFRGQTWPNTELILIFNASAMPADMPDLQANERVYALPEAASLGECLNRGITVARGLYWCKMDDDDYYSQRYLADTVMYYRSTQADVVGRQSGFFYFDGKGETLSRDFVGGRNFAILSMGEAISGATLSADMRWKGDMFSTRHRSHADADWVARVNRRDNRVFSAGFTEMVVYRDAVDENHTWRMNANVDQGNRYHVRAPYNMFDVFERLA